MNPDDQLAQWAGLFLARYSEETGADQTESDVVGILYHGITPLASELLHSVDTGGVPAFVTSSLKQIPESASSMTSPTPYPRHGHFFAALPSGCNETAAPVWL